MENQREEYRQAMHYFTQSLFRAGAGLGLAPISMLPKETQKQFKEAGHEFMCGLTKLAHGVATTLDTLEK